MIRNFGIKVIQTLGFALIVFVIFSKNVSAQSEGTKNWIGVYNFSDTAQISKRRNTYDVAPTAEYIITVRKNKEKLSAIFEINGMQMFEIYECSIKATSDKLSVYFQGGGIPDGGTNNPRNFKKGALLFSLAKTQSGKTIKYLFQQADFKIERLNPRAQKSDIYFKKQ